MRTYADDLPLANVLTALLAGKKITVFIDVIFSQLPVLGSKIIFFWIGFSLFSLLYADVNGDFVLILILYCAILIFILYCTTTYYYVLFHWRFMYV